MFDSLKFGEATSNDSIPWIRIYGTSLMLQIPCEVRCLGTQNPLPNNLQKGLEHKGIYIYMGVSKNNGTTKSSILIGFAIINHPFLGYP